MRRLSELLSKPIISLYEGKTEGTIKNAVFNKNLTKLKWLVLFDDKDILEQKYLPAKDIFSVGEQALVIKNGQAILPNLPDQDEEMQNNPINTTIYTPQGNLVDIVGDVLLDDKNVVEKIELKQKEQLNPDQIVVSGKDTLILQDEKNPINISSLKVKGFPKASKASDKRKVQVMQVKNEVEEIVEEITEQKPEELLKEVVEEKIEEIAEEKIEPKPQPKPKPKQKVEKTVKKEIEEKPKPKTNAEPKVATKPKKQPKPKKQIVEDKPLANTFEITKGIDEANESLEKAKKELIAKKEQLSEEITKLKKEVKSATKPNRFKEFLKRENKKNDAKNEVIKEEAPKPVKAKCFTFEQNTATPNIVFASNNFLLNRTALKNIYTINNELIIKAGEQITKQKIDKALICGKLQELIRFSK